MPSPFWCCCCKPCTCLDNLCVSIAGLQVKDGCAQVHPPFSAHALFYRGDGRTLDIGLKLAANLLFPDSCGAFGMYSLPDGTGMVQCPGYFSDCDTDCPDPSIDGGQPYFFINVGIVRSDYTYPDQRCLVAVEISLGMKQIFSGVGRFEGCGTTLVVDNLFTDFDQAMGDGGTPIAIGGTVTLEFNESSEAECAEDAELCPTGEEGNCLYYYSYAWDCVRKVMVQDVTLQFAGCVGDLSSYFTAWIPLGTSDGVARFGCYVAGEACDDETNCLADAPSPPDPPSDAIINLACAGYLHCVYRYICTVNCETGEATGGPELVSDDCEDVGAHDSTWVPTGSPVDGEAEMEIYLYGDECDADGDAGCGENIPEPPAPTEDEIDAACPSCDTCGDVQFSTDSTAVLTWTDLTPKTGGPGYTDLGDSGSRTDTLTYGGLTTVGGHTAVVFTGADSNAYFDCITETWTFNAGHIDTLDSSYILVNVFPTSGTAAGASFTFNPSDYPILYVASREATACTLSGSVSIVVTNTCAV